MDGYLKAAFHGNMKKKHLAIIVVAQGIPQSVIDRFFSSIKESLPAYPYDILVGKSDDSVFYKTKILNRLLSANMDKYNVIIQTDIDLVIPPGLINFSYESVAEAKTTAYHHALRYVRQSEIAKLRYQKYPFSEWLKLPETFCSGCWNAMTPEVWKKSRGYNEDMSAWGYEDTEFFNRSRRLGVQWIKDKRFALVHINHPPRQKNRVSENTSAGDKYSDQTDWLKGKIILR
jgi:hypothetical protein